MKHRITVTSCGATKTVYTTDSLPDLLNKYQDLMANGHQYVRLWVDGKKLLIYQAEKLANGYRRRKIGYVKAAY